MIELRPATFEDADKICAFQLRHGLSALTPEAWRQFWVSCPFREQFDGIPLAWLLEADQQLVGLLGNFHMLYELDRNPVKAGIATGWLVETEHRNGSLRMLDAYFRQKGLDLWLNDSANATTSKILTALKMQRIPAPQYDAPLFWPLRYRAFASAGLRRRGIPAAELLAWPIGVALRAAGVFRFRKPGYPSQVRRAQSFDDRFDSLWEKIRCGNLRLRAVRTSAVLRWRFQRELADRSAFVLAHERGGELQGYVVLLRRLREHLGFTGCDVADLQAVGDNPDVFRDLLIAAMHVAREVGAEALKFAGADGAKRTAALSLRPYSYRIDCWQLFYKTSRSDLLAALGSPELWDISPFETF